MTNFWLIEAFDSCYQRIQSTNAGDSNANPCSHFSCDSLHFFILIVTVWANVTTRPSLKTTTAAAQTARVPAPEDVLGFRPGDDRKLASWAKVVEYFQKLAAASDRVKFAELGKTTMGAPFRDGNDSAPETSHAWMTNRTIQEQLADPRKLGPNPDKKAAELIARGKTIVLITCGIHSDEVARISELLDRPSPRLFQ